MDAAWLIVIAGWPWLAAVLSTIRPNHWRLPLGAVPALTAPLMVETGSTLHLDWLLLGTHLGYDATTSLLLPFSALVWFTAGVYAATTKFAARSYRQFDVCFLVAMAGNFLLLLAADMLSFYLGFAVMGIAAYGMLIAPRSQRARHAGRVYLVFTLIGELALFAALVIVATSLGSTLFADLHGRTLPATAVGLLLLGFGIKLALPGLHLWLPGAYRFAPVVAVAVLSGPMMKAGLLGWLRFLPPGSVDPAWGDALLIIGSVGVVFGSLLGLAQREPRALLAYSSIAKMGLMTALFGAALAGLVPATALLTAIVLFAVHHLLVKPALFLGVDLRRHGRAPPCVVLGGTGLLALALLGAPLSGGAAAKQALTAALNDQLSILLIGAALGTALLMLRLMWLLHTQPAAHDQRSTAAPAAWLALVAMALWAPWLPWQITPKLSEMLPLLAALVIAVLAAGIARSLNLSSPYIAPGDMLPGAVRTAQLFVTRLRTLLRPVAFPEFSLPAPRATPANEDNSLFVAGLRWLAVFVVLLIAGAASG